MTIYYLMIKTHKNTGLKYLCQTKQKNYKKYSGSGKDWKLHLKEHGRQFDTEILVQTTVWDELTYWGRYYSSLYHVVGAMDDFGNKIWANKIKETGGGPGFTSEYLKKTHNRPETKEKIRAISTEIMNRPEQIAMRSGDNNSSRRPEVRSKMKISNKIAQNKPETKAKKKLTWSDPEKRNSVTGENCKKYDKKIYCFVNDNGIKEICNRHHLIMKYSLSGACVSRIITGSRKKYKGWMLLGTIG